MELVIPHRKKQIGERGRPSRVADGSPTRHICSVSVALEQSRRKA